MEMLSLKEQIAQLCRQSLMAMSLVQLRAHVNETIGKGVISLAVGGSSGRTKLNIVSDVLELLQLRP